MGRVETLIEKNSLGELLAKVERRYDGMGNKVKEAYGELYTILWQYGPNSRIQAVTEAVNTPEQTITSYAYDWAGRIQRRMKPDGVVLCYDYDTMGNLSMLSASDGSICYSYRYDRNQCVVEVEDQVHCAVSKRHYEKKQLITETLANGLSLSSRYNQAGQRIGFTLPDGSSIAYHYTSTYLSGIERISSAGESQYQHRYHIDQEMHRIALAEMVGGLGTIHYTYDAEGKIKGISTPYWTEEILARNDEGNITQLAIRDPSGTVESTYRYDEKQRISQESGEWEESSQYDLVNNRLSLTEGSYDPNGCLIERHNEQGTTHYRYDALNRLIAVEKEDEKVTYRYDPFGRRMSKTVEQPNCLPQTSRFLYDGEEEIGSVDEGENIFELRILGLGASAVALELDHHVYVPIHDHRGNLCCLVDPSSSEAVEWYRYSAFGRQHAYGSDGRQSPWGFASKRLDPETGFVYFGKRLYDPAEGRWITADPIGYADGINRYAYLHHNPIENREFYGLFSFDEWWQLFLDTMQKLFTSIVDGANWVIDSIRTHGSYYEHVKPELDKILPTLFGKTFLILSGYYIHPLAKGVYGNGEFGDHVRVTSINGILNLQEHCLDNAALLSAAHGGINIHYVFYPTEGWTQDVINALLAKFGYVTPHAKLLATTWKELIQEMGGTEGGGVIIHYAHSIGGTNTEIARGLLTPEEQKMIRVITLGSASAVANEGFDSVVNYISYRDGIFFIDPFRYLMNASNNIIYVGTPIGVPLIDHMLTMSTYRQLIEMLGQEFVNFFHPEALSRK
jgi:RHS repeat-associated protein